MDRQYKVGIVGATGMVGQRFVTLLENHPWFKLTVLAASGRSAGKSYEDAVGSRWAMTTPMPESVKKMTVLDASKVEDVASQVDFVFCAVNMPKDEIKALEEAYAKAECPVVSNNSAHRFTPDVPMVVPEINADHIEIIPAQRKRLAPIRIFMSCVRFVPSSRMANGETNSGGNMCWMSMGSAFWMRQAIMCFTLLEARYCSSSPCSFA